MKSYDDWKLNPEVTLADEIADEVAMMEDEELLEKCEIMGVNIDDELDSIAEKLCIALEKERASLRH